MSSHDRRNGCRPRPGAVASVTLNPEQLIQKAGQRQLTVDELRCVLTSAKTRSEPDRRATTIKESKPLDNLPEDETHAMIRYILKLQKDLIEKKFSSSPSLSDEWRRELGLTE